ncbi:MAG: STAS domain-containing protein [Sedimentisphaerales bacterium]|nr:STAS domain-containing protein [Sedimentisphaerales bacterium]
MGIEKYSGDAVFAILPKAPHLGDELDELIEIAGEGCDRDVVIDFSRVEMLVSESVCALMILDKYLAWSGRQLVLCNTPVPIMDMLERIGLSSVFTFADEERAVVQESGDCSCPFD